MRDKTSDKAGVNPKFFHIMAERKGSHEKVWLDAGHGGTDSGALGNNLREKILRCSLYYTRGRI